MVYQGFFFLQFKVFKKITYYFLYIIHYLNLTISFFIILYGISQRIKCLRIYRNYCIYANPFTLFTNIERTCFEGF